jgi:hypothetical protein
MRWRQTGICKRRITLNEPLTYMSAAAIRLALRLRTAFKGNSLTSADKAVAVVQAWKLGSFPTPARQLCGGSRWRAIKAAAQAVAEQTIMRGL